MDTEAAQTKGATTSSLARFAAFVCFAVACGLMISSLVAPAKARSALHQAGIDHIGYAVGSPPRS